MNLNYTRVKFYPLFFILFFQANELLAQYYGPANFPGLALWLRADSGVVQSGGSVSQWSDVSGNGVNATAASGAQPTITYPVEFNGKPALSFNGTTDQMTSALQVPNLQSSSLTIFILTK